MLCTCIELHLFPAVILSHQNVSIKHPLIFIKIMQLIAEEGYDIFNFTTPLVLSSFLIQSRTKFMETHWGCQKNSNVKLNEGTLSELELIPCHKV